MEPVYDKQGKLMPIKAHKTLTIEIYRHKKPIAVPEYTHEAIVAGAEKQYFYGHPTEEVVAKILANRLATDRAGG